MKRLILLSTALLSFLIASAKSSPPDTESPSLAAYDTHNLPEGIPIAYQDEDIALAFSFGNAGQVKPLFSILPDAPGDYYIMRIKSPSLLASKEIGLPYVLIGNNAIFKTDESGATLLSQIGWGLTKLHPQIPRIKPARLEFPVEAEFDSDIQQIISVITPQTSRRWIADLSAIATRYSYAQQCRQAEQYVYDHFDSMSLSPSFFEFQYMDTTMRNVIGELPGLDSPDSIIIVCGHQDCTSETPFVRAPGAEDNGSGCSVVLEAARALSLCQFGLTLRFVTFSGEEQGLVGSDAYAAYVQAQGELIAAVIDVDMVAYSGQYALDMHIFSDQQSYWLGALGSEIITTYTTLDTVPHYDLNPQYGSDHYPFAIRGYPAIFFIDAWFDFDWYPFYHTTADTLGNLNMLQQAAIGQGVGALAATLARLISGPPFIPGDANANGEVNGVDVVYLVNYLKGLGPPPPDPFLRADANGNCEVNGVDVVYLVNYLKGFGPEPLAGDCR